MDLEALVASLAPDGGPSTPAPPPEMSASTPPPDAGPQLPMGPQQSFVPHVITGDRPGSGGGGIASQLQEMLPMLIAGLMSGAALKNPGPYGRGEDVSALAQGLLHGYHTSKQGQLAQRQQGVTERRLQLEEDRQKQDAADRAAGRAQKTTELTQKHDELSTNFMLNAVKGAEQFKDDPASWASYTKMMDGIGSKVFGLTPGSLTEQLQFPDAARGKKATKEAKARVDDLTKLYGPEKMFAPEVLDATTTFDGKPIKVRDLMALAEMTIAKPSALAPGDAGPQQPSELVAPPQKEEPLDRQVLRSYAKKINKAVPDLTPAEIKAAREEAGLGADPALRALAREAAQGRIDKAGQEKSDAQEIAAGIIDGSQPPDLARMYGKSAAVRAELHRQGYDLTTATKDWQATQKFIATANGGQQTKMRQSIDNATHSLDVIDSLAAQWQAGQFPALNAGRLAAAKQGVLGADAQKIATQLSAQIADVTSELGNVYMGGNSPTDHALGLAQKNLSENWSMPTLTAATDLARKNLHIRANSMKNVGPVGVGGSDLTGSPAQSKPTGKFNPATGKVEPVK